MSGEMSAALITMQAGFEQMACDARLAENTPSNWR